MTEVWVQEREKGILTDAWRFALLQRGKDLPKKPEHIWGEGNPDGSITLDVDTMIAAGKARAAEKKRRLIDDGRKKQRGQKQKT